ncbi:hypothetical protein FDN13_13140 [Caloramator sp. E03]|uniref:hypothetical protein n=1 Tax=Caloramator sp. E03 TaxID=2576307 RepID=UPI0011101C57|nr:hypothetical protein [Caloramator sp. E03]QCX34567.1 hypothetical protein FDN13_13140 [Caloramator sp. E03]
MVKIINSNCKKCPYLKAGSCSGEDKQCICRFCPRNIATCITVKWCRETESPLIIEYRSEG